MRNLKLVPKKANPVSAEQLAEMLKSRKRILDGEVWIPVSAIVEVLSMIEGGGK
ncbi:hypothetical protein D9M68_693010 [compost metagenome]